MWVPPDLVLMSRPPASTQKHAIINLPSAAVTPPRSIQNPRDLFRKFMGRLFLHYLESPSNKGVYACKKCALLGETVHLARMDDILSKVSERSCVEVQGFVESGSTSRFEYFDALLATISQGSEMCRGCLSCSPFILEVGRRTSFISA